MEVLLPFTREQFFAVFATYNTATWPAPAFAYVLGSGVVAAVWCAPGTRNARAAAYAVLAGLWIWTGVFYHGAYFAAINPAAWGFAVLFAVQAMLFLQAAATTRTTPSARPEPLGRAVGLTLAIYAMAVYPLLVAATGHAYPAAPAFGVTACPLVIFTFSLYLLMPEAPRRLWLIPTLWAVIGGSAAFLLDVTPDWSLPASALAAVLIALRAKSVRAR